MGRIKLQLPEKFLFSTEIPVRITDLNYGGHLGNDNLLSIVHEARIQFLNKLGYSELDIEGCGIIMVDSVINYISESFYGDRLFVEVTVDNITRSECDIFYRLTNMETKKEVARVKTGILFFDYEKRRRLETPKEFQEKINSIN